MSIAVRPVLWSHSSVHTTSASPVPNELAGTKVAASSSDCVAPRRPPGRGLIEYTNSAGGRTLSGSGVLFVPAGRFSLEVQAAGNASFEVVGIGDLGVGDLAEAGPGAVVGDQARVQQSVAHRPG